MRAAARLGFTVISLQFNSAGSSSRAGIDQNALVFGGGAEAFDRCGGWEVHGGARLRTPIDLGGANASFFGGGATTVRRVVGRHR